MQRYTMFFIIVDALHISGGFSAHYQELKNCKHSIWYVPGLLLLPLAWLGWNSCVYSPWAPDNGRRNRPKYVEHRQ
jgi:drug/metabolite transporter superfamily protein YnfA